MSTTANDVAHIAQRIEGLMTRSGWQTDAHVASDAVSMLGKLTTVKADVRMLKTTGIGKIVKKLTKHQDDVVKGYSSSLMSKWKEDVGVTATKPTSSTPAKPTRPLSNGSANGSRQPSPARGQPVNPAPSPADPYRYENARKKLQETYANERAKREARTVQVLTRPITSKRRGTTISAAPSRSSLARSRMSMQQTRPMGRTGGSGGAIARGLAGPRPMVSSSSSVTRSSTLTPPGRRPLPASTSTTTMPRRPATAPPGSNDPDEARRRRRERLLMLSQQSQGGGTGSDSTSGSHSNHSRGRGRVTGSSSTSAPARRAPVEPRAAPMDPAISARKAMLDRKYPRVCAAPTPAANGASRRNSGGSAANGKVASSSSSSKKKKTLTYTEGQREVLQWLSGLDVDMSSYAPAFFDNGFDSIKLLNEIKSRDLDKLVPKMGHHRMIEKALKDLQRQRATMASSARRPRSAPRGRERSQSRPTARNDSYFDEESDDSFVVSDGDEYAPGAITAMLRKGRKRSYSMESDDSINMEASYADIQNEEERSKRIGEYEDYREELRNKSMKKKKK